MREWNRFDQQNETVWRYEEKLLKSEKEKQKKDLRRDYHRNCMF